MCVRLIPSLEEKNKGNQALRKTFDNKGCSLETRHGTYAHPGPCCTSLNCKRRKEDI